MMGNEHVIGTGRLSPRVVVYGLKSQEIHIHNPHAVAERLGGNVLAAFYKCFNGADRLRALQHVMDLVHHAERIEDAHDDQAAGYTRNRTVIGFLLAGAVRETAIALNELHGTRITHDPCMQEAWGPIDAIRLLYEDKYARNIRNNFAMHLGELRHYVDGIMAGNDETAVLFMNSGKAHGGVFPETWNALFRAHRLEDKDMDAFVELTKEAHETLPPLLINLFRDALELRGVPVVFEPGRRLVEPAAG